MPTLLSLATSKPFGATDLTSAAAGPPTADPLRVLRREHFG